MRNALKKIGPPAFAAVLGLGLLTPLALSQISCTTAAKDKADSQVPAISLVSFATLATPTTTWPTNAANSWVMTAGTTTSYIKANFAATGGTAVLMPGNIPIVSGMPIQINPTATTTYLVTVTDAAGHSTAGSATLGVVPPPDADITAPAAAIANAAGLTASVPTDPALNAAGTKYSWSAKNASITSDPTQPKVTFTAGSANTDGSAQNMTLTCSVTNPATIPVNTSKTVTVPVDAVPPSGLVYPASTVTLYLGLAAAPDVPTTSGIVQLFSISPALPAGLTFDPLHGVIAGTPTALAPAANYTVTAMNSGGSTQAVVNLAVLAQPSVVFSASPAKIGPAGTSILSWSTGSNVTKVAITASPADATLPASFATSGTVNVNPAVTTVYTLVATLTGGTTAPAETFTVTVDATPLAFSSFTATPATNIAFGGTTTLAWTLAGIPNTLTLNSPNSSSSPSLLGSTSSVVPVVRRQTYTLNASNGVNGVNKAATQPLMVFASGLDNFAGNSTQGAGSHDGQGTAAQFNQPFNCAMDPAGNLYVPDASNHTIRLVTPSGAVSTLAGTSGVPGITDNVPGLQAQFNQPRAVAYWQDASNNNAPYLFVVEYANHSVRKIALSTSGPITATNVKVFAGTVGSYGTSGNYFDNPTALVIDSSNNMFLTEGYDGDVLKITGLNTATGTITSYAGSRTGYGYNDGPNATALFDGCSGIAVDAAGNLYVSEGFNHRVRKVTATTTSTLTGTYGALSTAAASGFVDGPLGTSRVNTPGGVVVSGNTLYIADTHNNAVRALNLTTGNLTTVLGAAATGSTTPGLPGNQNGNGNAALLSFPQGLLLDGSGNLLISELGNNDIRKADPSLNVTTLAGSAPIVGSADGAAGTGAIAINPGLSANVTMAGMVMDSNSNIYLADTYNNAIRKISPAGVISTIAGVAGLTTAGHLDGVGAAASFNQPAGIAMDGSGNLYVADQSNCTVRKLVQDPVAKTWTVSTIAGIPLTTGVVNGAGSIATFKYPYGITVTPNGNIYVADSGNKFIRQLAPVAGGTYTVSTVTTSGVTLSVPTGLASDASGNLFMTDRKNNFVAKLTAPTAPATTWAGTIIGGFSSTTGGFAVGAPNATGTVSTTTSSKFNNPQGICVDAAGNVWVADYSNNLVRKITNTAGVWTTSTQSANPTLQIGQGALTVGQPAAGIPIGTSVGPLGSATLYWPQAVVIAPNGHDLFITTNGGVAQATSIDGQ